MQLPEDQYEGYPGYSFSAEFPCHSVDLVLQTSSGPPASSSEPRPARPLPPPLMSCSYRPAHVHFYIGMRVKSGFFLFFQKVSLGNGKKVWSVIWRIQPDEPTICAFYWCCKKLPQKRKSKKSRCVQGGLASSGDSRRESVPCLLQFPNTTGTLCLWPHDSNLCLLLHIALPSHWTLHHPSYNEPVIARSSPR